MRLIIIRHGDPDYAIDSLTQKGWREAELLSRRLSGMDVKAFYLSALGRAKDTASITLKKMNRKAVVFPWLREFNAPITDERTGGQRIPWDWLPSEWTRVNEYYEKNLWYSTPIMREGNVGEEVSRVHAGLDGMLRTHGYEREGQVYHAVHPNKDTVILFCHFGVECVILGHLIGVSPMVLWHGICAAPTSVTTLVTEERRKGIASFRMISFGDISHLYAAGEEPAFAARFCETYDDLNQRHD